MIITELVLKVASVCNLNCSYCYVFNKGDHSYATEPNFLDKNLIDVILTKINRYCKKHEIANFIIIFHGGEPLLIGKDFYIHFINRATELVTSTRLIYTLQTNGTLLTKSWCELLSNLNIGIGVSLDGPAEASKYRIFKSTLAPAHNEIIKGFEILSNTQDKTAILTVINVDESPDVLYEYFKSLNVNELDLLFPDANHDKKDKAVGRLGGWLIQFFKIWYNDTNEQKPGIRLFIEIIKLFLFDEYKGYDPMGRIFNGIITVKPNGNIEPVDALRICGSEFMHTGLNIKDNNIEDIESNIILKRFYYAHQDNELCNICQCCIIKKICGGSQLSHRYSELNEFDNPSVYCNDIIELVVFIQNALYEDIPELKILGMERLTHDDFSN